MENTDWYGSFLNKNKEKINEILKLYKTMEYKYDFAKSGCLRESKRDFDCYASYLDAINGHTSKTLKMREELSDYEQPSYPQDDYCL